MSTSTIAMTSSPSVNIRVFWERLWRMSGINRRRHCHHRVRHLRVSALH